MKYQESAHTTTRHTRLVLLMIVALGIAGVVFVIKPSGGEPADLDAVNAPSPSNRDAASARPADPAMTGSAVPGRLSSTRASGDRQGRAGGLPPLDERSGRSSAVSVFDENDATIANLRPAVRAELQQAAIAARSDGVTIYVTSGWRSAAQQQELLNQAIAEYGSEAEALKWVATPQSSPHVRGEALDIGHDGAVGWLSKHGAAYDLCQIYRNEPWHYELRAGAAESGCPVMYADPTHDPRMQK